VVVDPGVGSARRPILVEAGGHYFVGPDNGVFSMIYDGARIKVREISNPKYVRKEVSRTFHGRDVFAPAAAHLSLRVPLTKFGKPVTDYIRSSVAKSTPCAKNQWRGTILKVDRFGNLITNFHITDFPEVQAQPIELRVGLERIHRLALTYAEAEIGEVFAIVGSSGYIEVAANQASAAKTLGCGAGAPVELEIYF
jgi:S-adenosyl-L-methionine hydrolase (adenosine-forming)